MLECFPPLYVSPPSPLPPPSFSHARARERKVNFRLVLIFRITYSFSRNLFIILR